MGVAGFVLWRWRLGGFVTIVVSRRRCKLGFLSGNVPQGFLQRVHEGRLGEGERALRWRQG